MHYPIDAFSRNGSATLEPKENESLPKDRIGYVEDASPLDLLKVCRAYQCDPSECQVQLTKPTTQHQQRTTTTTAAVLGELFY